MFDEYPPGLLFVVATLLPLASFALLLVWGGVRWLLRSYAKDGGPAAVIYDAIGGDVGGAVPAYVATAAIGLACALCVWGFTLFWIENQNHEHDVTGLRKQIEMLRVQALLVPKKDAKKTDAKKAEKELFDLYETLETKEREFEQRWSCSIPWAGVLPRVAADPGQFTPEEPGNGTLLRLGYRIDMLSALMFVMVTFIASLIHLFSIGYMSDEAKPIVEDHEVHAEDGHLRRRGRFGRFFMFLSLFCFSMLNLVLADNLFQVFVSWELVGICSFLLIGYYFERQSASNAANKAFITNRIGDAGFIIGVMILWTHVGTLNFEELFSRIRWPGADAHRPIPTAFVNQLAYAQRGSTYKDGFQMHIQPSRDGATDVLVLPRGELEEEGHRHWHFEKTPKAVRHPDSENYGYIPYWMFVACGLGIFLGCVGKSAQFPLQVWLPDAMEGPTPVSALIHAATMVAAGVYLVARCYPLFSQEVLLVIAYTGGITLFVAATIALVMTDIKKVLAYSTVSQLGYMMLALGVGGWVAGSFHLITHAFFKALLFLGSGSVIYGCHHQQDMLKMGGLYPKMKITAITMLVGVFAICGIPLFAGWYSKDAILVNALSFADNNRQHFLLFGLPLVTAGLTTFYMFRMWFMTFTGTPRDHHVFEHAHESPWQMTVPLIVLAVFSVFVAWGLPPWEAHESQLAHELEHSRPASVAADFGEVVSEEAQSSAGYHETAGGLALGMVLIGVVFAGAMYYKNLLDPADAKEQFPGVHRFLMHKWYFDEVYSALLVRPGLVIAGWCRAFDTYVIDGIVNGIGRWTVLTSVWSGKADRGIVDGLVNVMADAWYGIGGWLRTLQTGYIRSYILFLALGAVAIWLLLAALFGVGAGAP